MDNMGQAIAGDAAGQLDLRRVLFELLVLCGMDRKEGYTREVDPAMDLPDPVREANYYLKSNKWRDKIARFIKWRNVVCVTAVIVGVCMLLWFYIQTGIAWILLDMTALIFAGCFVQLQTKQQLEFAVSLSDDGHYKTWLNAIEKAMRADMILKPDPDRPDLLGMVWREGWCIKHAVETIAIEPRLYAGSSRGYTAFVLLRLTLFLCSVVTYSYYYYEMTRRYDSILSEFELPLTFVTLAYVLCMFYGTDPASRIKIANLRAYLIEHLRDEILSTENHPAVAESRPVLNTAMLLH